MHQKKVLKNILNQAYLEELIKDDDYIKGKTAALKLVEKSYKTEKELEDKLPEGGAMEQLLFLNRQLFKMIEDEIDIELLTKLYSTQLVTKGEKQLDDHNRVYYKLLRKIAAAGQKKGEIYKRVLNG